MNYFLLTCDTVKLNVGNGRRGVGTIGCIHGFLSAPPRGECPGGPTGGLPSWSSLLSGFSSTLTR